MEITAEIKFEIEHCKDGKEWEKIILDTPTQTLQKIQELENTGFPISKINVTAQISNCAFKRAFHIQPYHTLRFHDFKNFRHAFNCFFH